MRLQEAYVSETWGGLPRVGLGKPCGDLGPSSESLSIGEPPSYGNGDEIRYSMLRVCFGLGNFLGKGSWTGCISNYYSGC
jgi:hypothetical protein